jgi:hypothetical protein
MATITATRPAAHDPVPALDGTPGVCICGLLLDVPNVRHMPDPQARADALEAERRRYASRDDWDAPPLPGA